MSEQEYQKVTVTIETSEKKEVFLIPKTTGFCMIESIGERSSIYGGPTGLMTLGFEMVPIPNDKKTLYYHMALANHRLNIEALGTYDQLVSCLDCDWDITLNANPTLSELNIISDEHNREVRNG